MVSIIHAGPYTLDALNILLIQMGLFGLPKCSHHQSRSGFLGSRPGQEVFAQVPQGRLGSSAKQLGKCRVIGKLETEMLRACKRLWSCFSMGGSVFCSCSAPNCNSESHVLEEPFRSTNTTRSKCCILGFWNPAECAHHVLFYDNSIEWFQQHSFSALLTTFPGNTFSQHFSKSNPTPIPTAAIFTYQITIRFLYFRSPFIFLSLTITDLFDQYIIIWRCSVLFYHIHLAHMLFII